MLNDSENFVNKIIDTIKKDNHIIMVSEWLNGVQPIETDELIKYLKSGLSCIILENVNTGNLLLTDNGKYKYIDTEWMARGLNLYQFEKIDYFCFDEKERYNIADEAEECYRAYFNTLGIKDDGANEQIMAYELLSALRKNTYLKYLKKDDDREIERRIKIIIGKNKFI